MASEIRFSWRLTLFRIWLRLLLRWNNDINSVPAVPGVFLTPSILVEQWVVPVFGALTESFSTSDPGVFLTPSIMVEQWDVPASLVMIDSFSSSEPSEDVDVTIPTLKSSCLTSGTLWISNGYSGLGA
jgi:hypothetical protein